MTTITPSHNGNGGIVPPWLQHPAEPIIVLPVEPHAVRNDRLRSGATVASSVIAGTGTYIALVDREHALVRFETGMSRVPVATLTMWQGDRS